MAHHEKIVDLDLSLSISWHPFQSSSGVMSCLQYVLCAHSFSLSLSSIMCMLSTSVSLRLPCVVYGGQWG